MAQEQKLPKIYNLESINAVVNSTAFEKELIEALRDGFRSYSTGLFNACPIQTMGAPPMTPFCNVENYAAQTCVKSGYVTGASHFVIKVASGGYPLPNSGLMQVYSQSTGKLEALLLDEGILTELRTAAVGALVASMLAPKSIRCIGILGSGVQARYQLQFLRHVTDCRHVLVWGRTSAHVVSFREDVTKDGWTVQVAGHPDDLLEQCDLIVTTTSSRVPLLGVTGASRKKAQHITCIGADATGKIELNPTLVAEANLLVVDSFLQGKERGEFEIAIQINLINEDNLVELGSLVDQSELHRSSENDERLTIFDSSGVAVQDCIIAKMTYDALLAIET